MNVFLYDDLLEHNKLSKVIDKSLKPIPAVVSGFRMYSLENFEAQVVRRKLKILYPVMIKLDEAFKVVKPPYLVYGGIYTFEDKNTLKLLDAYYNCSMYSLGENKSNDMYHRIMVESKSIRFDNINKFMCYEFGIEEIFNAYTYIGNINHYNCRIQKIKNRRASIGCFWRSFIKEFDVER